MSQQVTGTINSTWRCKRGHEFQAIEPLWLSVGKLESGPLCAQCVVEQLRQEFGVERVARPGEFGEAVVVVRPQT